jgi:glycosyltransferase involved in cell wall biosynthesis
MMGKDLVSIALCTYNGEKYLPAQLDTLVSQTYANIEIVVVDDCSTDNTYTILEEYCKKYPQIRISKNEHNLGYVKNFEAALKLCNGSLIALCDQDDIWDTRKIELQVIAIDNNVLVYHDSEFINEKGETMNKKMSDLMNLYSGDNPGVFLFFNCISGHTILMKKELLNNALPFKEGYFHDWWLAYVATNIGAVKCIPQCLVKYRQHSNNDTDVLRRKQVKKQSSVNKIMRIHQWLKYCAEYPGNKYPALVNDFYEAYTIRINTYISFKLSLLLFKYRSTIFAIRNKSKINMLNYIYQQIWGAKIKEL